MINCLRFWCILHKNIVQFEVIVDLAYAVQLFKLIEECDADLTNPVCWKAAIFISKIGCQRSAQLLHYNIRVMFNRVFYPLIIFLLTFLAYHLACCELTASVDFCETIWIFIWLPDFSELIRNLKFLLTHFHFFGQFYNDNLTVVFGIFGRVYLAKVTFGHFVHQNKPIWQF